MKINNIKKKDFIYIDYSSITTLILLIIILIFLTCFFLSLGIIGYLISSFYSYFFIKRFNYVLAYKNDFFVLKHFLLLKKVKIENIVKLKCEISGFGTSRDSLVFLYYRNDDNLEKSIFLHYKITGYKKLILFLNKIDGMVEIDESSFNIIGIKKINNLYVKN